MRGGGKKKKQFLDNLIPAEEVMSQVAEPDFDFTIRRVHSADSSLGIGLILVEFSSTQQKNPVLTPHSRHKI